MQEIIADAVCLLYKATLAQNSRKSRIENNRLLAESVACTFNYFTAFAFFVFERVIANSFLIHNILCPNYCQLLVIILLSDRTPLLLLGSNTLRMIVG